MTETIYSRAVMSAFQDQLDAGIPNPKLQLKTVERRMRQLPAEETGTFSELSALLLKGLFITFDDQQYVAQVGELRSRPTGGLVKKLSRVVDKKTRNPKTSRGTVWRRNSAVKERRRILPNWRSGSTAQLAAKRKSTVQLVPLEVWTATQNALDLEKRQSQLIEIRDKQASRNRKQALITEYDKRIESQTTDQELLAKEAMVMLTQLAEKRGVAQETELYRRILFSLENGQPIPILFVWGPPYEGQGLSEDIFLKDTPEERMASEIENVFMQLAKLGLYLQPILLYADTYGTQINGLTNAEVCTYYQQLEQRFDYAVVTKWSEIIADNQQRYDQVEQEVLANLVVSEKTVENAQMMQTKLGFQINKQRATQLGAMYTKERTVEGVMLEEGFMLRGQRIENLVKLSTAPTRFRNDEPYEAGLPRIYVQGMTRAAWNAAR